ncbi:sodium-dependent transporter [Galactobacter valiniphilus]|uniref:Sodium-dependent transporter n=1 Tax=Galactobacter valiniphilus TaxID=2676122 RepID=A0A399JHR2_9MICC|nr:sodium-dependent transporter [Galactobacter valiniphilus]RII43692.1 sodium-dependent transporter [Galactobacter valiniphilus]
MSSPTGTGGTAHKVVKREAFGSRNVFILSAIGSAVGLGNIWRFPYVAYEGGGGAFLVPYLCALLTAGIPLLFLDYSIGHRFRGSAPLAFRRLNRKTEVLGWWQVLICVVIAVYYAAIIAWSTMYTAFSATLAWGKGNEETFFFSEFLQMGKPTDGVSFDYVPGVLWPMLGVWAVILVIMVLGVKKGIGMANNIFMPLLTVMFLIMVIQAVLLPGAMDGLNAFFTPNWEALKDPAVWASAYGHIFFSLSVAFGIMVTYSSYLKRKTDLTGSGLVVGFANSSFEILAGIGVFAALGFMAQASGQGVNDVASGGIGLAFVAFPTIASNAAGGSIIGMLFFGSLVFAGVTSLISILEVIVAAVQDKLGWARVKATLVVTIPIAIVSIVLFASTSGLFVLDITDAFINQFGIMAVAFVTVLVVAYGVRALPKLATHLNGRSTFKVGLIWRLLVGIVGPLALGYMLVSEIIAKTSKPYEGYPGGMLAVFGWGMVAAVIVLSVVLAMIPWGPNSKAKNDPEYREFLAAEGLEPDREQIAGGTGGEGVRS